MARSVRLEIEPCASRHVERDIASHQQGINEVRAAQNNPAAMGLQRHRINARLYDGGALRGPGRIDAGLSVREDFRVGESG